MRATEFRIDEALSTFVLNFSLEYSDDARPNSRGRVTVAGLIRAL